MDYTNRKQRRGRIEVPAATTTVHLIDGPLAGSDEIVSINLPRRLLLDDELEDESVVVHMYTRASSRRGVEYVYKSTSERGKPVEVGTQPSSTGQTD